MNITQNYIHRRLLVASLMAMTTAVWSADQLPAGTGSGLFGYYYVNQVHSVGDVSGNPVLARTDALLDLNWPNGIPDSSMSSAIFSAVWNGLLEPRLTGTYTIFITSDNGRRVWINGQPVVNQWINDWGITYSGTINLVAGQKVPIRVDLFNADGPASIKLEWQDPNGNREVIPTSQLYPEPLPTGSVGSGSGLLAGYFPGPSFTGTPTVKTDSTVNFSWPSTPFDGFPSEYFSVRWQGKIVPPLDEPTTLILSSDDGARLWVDGVQVVDDWTDHGTKEYRYALPIGAGVAHDIRLDYYEGAAPGVAKLEWEGQHTPRKPVPSTQLYPASNLVMPFATSGAGLSAAYYSNETLTGFALRRRDQAVNFDWGGGSPDSAIPVDHFSARWTGKIQTRFDEQYTLIVTGDDGVRVWLDGAPVIDDWVPSSPRARLYTFSAKAGQKYDLRIEYFEQTGGAVARLEWQSASEGRQIVPEACLYPNDLDINIPTAFVTSPAFIEGVHGPSLTINSGTGKATLLGESRFFIEQPLSVGNPATASISAGSVTVTGAITWTPTLLSGTQNIVVRPGDSLLFKAASSGTWSIGLNCGTFKDSAPINPGDSIPVKFDVPGFYTVNQTDSTGAIIAAISVSVPKVLTTGSIPVAVDFTRNKDVTLSSAGDIPLVTWTASDQWITIGNGSLPDGSPGTSQRLTVKPSLNRAAWMMGRINGASGPILSELTIRPFIFHSNSQKYIDVDQVYPDGSMLCSTALVMEPLIPSLSVKLSAFVSGVTFDDSTTLRWLTSDDFTPNGTNGIYSFKLIRAPGIGTGVCHAWQAFDQAEPISK